MTYKLSSGTLNLCSLTHSYILTRPIVADNKEAKVIWQRLHQMTPDSHTKYEMTNLPHSKAESQWDHSVHS